MQAGIITEQNLAQILRGIGQKRRHGVLEVHAGDKILEVGFFQGKIVDVVEGKIPLARKVAWRLAQREIIATGAWIEAIENREQLVTAFMELGEQVSEDMLSFALKQQALEDLYALELGEGSYYHFRVEMVPAPAEHDLQFSVGQLLLDLVMVKESHTEFVRRFPPESLIGRGVRQDRDYSLEEEDLIWLINCEVPLATLRQRSLLSRLSFDETLSSLVDCGVLRKIGEEPRKSDLFDLSALDASIDQYAEETCQVLMVKTPVHPEAGVPVSEGVVARSQPPLKSSIRLESGKLEQLNIALLENPLVPEIVVLVFVCAAVIIPLLLW